MRSGTDEMERAAAAWRSRPSVAQSRTWNGDDALEYLDRLATLELMELRGRVIDIEIEHR